MADSLISLNILKTCNCFLMSVLHWFSNLCVSFKDCTDLVCAPLSVHILKCLGPTAMFQSFFGCVVSFTCICSGGVFGIYSVVRLLQVG